MSIITYLWKASCKENLRIRFIRKKITKPILKACLYLLTLSWQRRIRQQNYENRRLCCCSGYQSHAPFNNFFPFQKLSFGGRQSNVSMTIVVFISWQFHGHLACERRRISGCRLHRGECLLCSGRLLAVLRSVILPSIIQINARRQVSLVTINARFFPLGI